jgi:hypothetical protein
MLPHTRPYSNMVVITVARITYKTNPSPSICMSIFGEHPDQSLGSRQAFQKGNYETNDATTNPSIQFACRFSPFSVSSQIRVSAAAAKHSKRETTKQTIRQPIAMRQKRQWRCGVSIPIPYLSHAKRALYYIPTLVS